MRRNMLEHRLAILTALNGKPKILTHLMVETRINYCELKARHLSILIHRGYIEVSPPLNEGEKHSRHPDKKIKGIFRLSEYGKITLRKLSEVKEIIDDLGK